MFSQSHKSMNRTVLKLFLIAVLSMAVQAVYAQDSTDSSSAPAKPVLPASDTASNSGKDVAKATELPSTDTPRSRVSDVHGDNYVIGVDDVLNVNVWKEGDLSRSVPVRPDGMITLPLVGEIKASGLTPVQLQDQITTALQKVMSDPVVTVSVTGVNSLTFNIMGQVNKPGYFPLNHPLTILDAIALAGGFRDFAKQKKIYVLRTTPDGKHVKLYFNYKEVIKGRKMAQNIYLEPRDTLVIP
jgi:polysaccharide biosynthesis/export protein